MGIVVEDILESDAISDLVDLKIAKTTLTTNQLGYVEYGEHVNFRNGLLLPTECQY